MAKTSQAQDKYDALLLDTIKSIDTKTDEMTKRVIKQGMELKSNTAETRLLKTEVRETNGSVKDLQGEVIAIKRVVFPENPITTKDLSPLWKDSKIIRFIIYVIGIAILTAIGINVSDILK